MPTLQDNSKLNDLETGSEKKTKLFTLVLDTSQIMGISPAFPIHNSEI